MGKGIYLSLDHIINDTSFDAAISASNGIIRKIIFQFNTFIKFGFEMTMFCPYAKRIHFFHAIARRLPLTWLRGYGKLLVNHAMDYSFIYLRCPWYMDKDTVTFIKKMKQKNTSIKIIAEIPTYTNNNWKGEINHIHMLPLAIKNNISTKKLSKYVDRYLTFTNNEVEINGIKTICTFNAIDSQIIKPIQHIESAKNTINLIACSSMAFWHGYDRMIEGLYKYYQKNQTVKIYFHIVGDGEELPNIRELVNKFGIQNYVKIYGYKSGKELDTIYNFCDIAVDSLGRHRSNIYYNSSLKSKEYLAKGLPVISSVTNELDYDLSFKYYKKFPHDESPINVEKIIDFYNNIYNNTISRNEIISEISFYASKNFSYEKSFQALIEYLNE